MDRPFGTPVESIMRRPRIGRRAPLTSTLLAEIYSKTRSRVSVPRFLSSNRCTVRRRDFSRRSNDLAGDLSCGRDVAAPQRGRRLDANVLTEESRKLLFTMDVECSHLRCFQNTKGIFFSITSACLASATQENYRHNFLEHLHY